MSEARSVGATVVVVANGGSCRSVVAGSVVAFTATPGVGGGTCPTGTGASQSTAIDVPSPMSAAVTSSVNVIGGGAEVN